MTFNRKFLYINFCNLNIHILKRIDDTVTFTIRLIDEEKVESDNARLRSGSKRIAWDSYARYSEIAAFVQELPQLNSIASVEVIGKSYENRDIFAVKISNSPNNRRAILIDAGMSLSHYTNS